MGIAFIFPGQGSQYAGMGRAFYEKFTLAREVFQRANETLGFDLTKLIFEGGGELNKTVNTQPAILTVSFAIYTVLKELYPELKPMLVAGHSLGEYTALLSAGVLEFEDALKLVRYRAQYMQSAVPEGEGGMAAVIGISPEEVAKLCQEVEGVVEPVNFNSPIQTVVAGQAKAVKDLVRLAKSRKIKAIPLKVSVPSHSSLMRVAGEKFKEKLKEVSFKDAQTPVVQNYTAQAHTKAQEIKENLYLQLFNPVRWVESVEFMHSQGVDTFIEIGPKNVLTKLVTQILPSVKAFNVERVEDLEKLKEV
ncbi:MAG TPA: ACP S-malonyltransferase [Aquificales bacterium]|nr:ACP S-malonyltransferase [Aquificales bacterium]